MKKKLDGAEWKNAAGTKTHLELTWHSWKDKLPPAYQEIYIIIQLENGFYPVTGEFLDPKNFQYVRFNQPVLPDCYLKSDDGWRLHLWAKAKRMKHAPIPSTKNSKRRRNS